MKVVVTGGRDYGDYEQVYRSLAQLPHDAVVIHGDARGADRLAHRAASALGLEVLPTKAEWARYGKRAGYIRNAAMADMKPDLVIAFPGGKGTQMMCGIAKSRGIRVLYQPVVGDEQDGPGGHQGDSSDGRREPPSEEVEA